MSSDSPASYRKGLHEVADGTFAYLQPDGGWGWSNAGLLAAEGESMLVDTLFDLALTQDMLDEMERVTAGLPIKTLINTHANGDHCFGNELVGAEEIIASERAANEMDEAPPQRLNALMKADFGPELNGFLREAFGAFDFSNITLTPPTRTFVDHLTLDVGGRSVELIEVGPAHTAGDILIHVPETKTVFTGDILFITGTPLVWAGPFSNWIAACDRIIDLGCDVIVPGHGPLTDRAGVEVVKGYLEYIHAEASARHAAGMSVVDAAFDIDLGEYSDLGDAERIAVNVDSVYRELDPEHERPDIVNLFEMMAKLAARG